MYTGGSSIGTSHWSKIFLIPAAMGYIISFFSFGLVLIVSVPKSISEWFSYEELNVQPSLIQKYVSGFIFSILVIFIISSRFQNSFDSKLLLEFGSVVVK